MVTATSGSTDLTFQSQYKGPGSSYGTFLDDVSVNPITAAVPEPGSLTLSGLGALVLLAYGSWRRRNPSRLSR